MDVSTLDFQGLLDRARQGCPDATRRLYDDYAEYVLRVVRRRLKGSLRIFFDSDDFVQEVWSDFFTKHLCDHDFDSPEQLATFLCAIANSRVTDQARRQTRPAPQAAPRKRRLCRRRGGTSFPRIRPLVGGDGERPVEANPRATLAAPPARVALLSEGYSVAEVAAALGRREATVREIRGKAAHELLV